jgi:hypothetical protein
MNSKVQCPVCSESGELFALVANVSSPPVREGCRLRDFSAVRRNAEFQQVFDRVRDKRADCGPSLRPQTEMGNLEIADARGCNSVFPIANAANGSNEPIIDGCCVDYQFPLHIIR